MDIKGNSLSILYIMESSSHLAVLLFGIFIICSMRMTFALLDDLRLGCPVPNLDSENCAGVSVSRQCNITTDCFKQNKGKHTLCCVTDCRGTKCIESLKKMGQCPDTKPIGARGCSASEQAMYKCGIDSDCTDRKKCCYDGCGGTACYNPKGPEPKKLGCPMSTKKQSNCLKLADECIFDDECIGNNGYCCRHPCGYNYCRTTQTNKGDCPKPPIKSGFCKPSDINFDCGEDSDCLVNEKCCPWMCRSTKCIGGCKDDNAWRADFDKCSKCSCKKLKKQKYGVMLAQACMDNEKDIMVHCCESCKPYAGFFEPMF